MFQQADEPLSQKWQIAWQSGAFRRRLITGFVLVAVVLCAFPFFFQLIEKRNGPVLHDWILAWLPAHDISVSLFIVVWAISGLTLIRAIQNPGMVIHFVWAYLLLCIFRILAISIVPLDPPVNLIPLADPVSNFFYGRHEFVTKDLFFSGHTGTVFLMFLCLRKKTDRLLGMLATGLVGMLLLIQHIHYTIDVIGAPFFAYFSYSLAFRIAGGEWFGFTHGSHLTTDD
jgi:hypothetical protein